MCDVIIIGAGASGIVSSIFAKKKDNKVIILERNDKSLKKLLMTGNGRCNYMNESYSTKNYHSMNIDIVGFPIDTPFSVIAISFNVPIVRKVLLICFIFLQKIMARLVYR